MPVIAIVCVFVMCVLCVCYVCVICVCHMCVMCVLLNVEVERGDRKKNGGSVNVVNYVLENHLCCLAMR